MRTLQVAVLAVLAAASVAATAAVMRTGVASIASDRRGEQVLPGLGAKAGDITGLVITQDKAPLTIQRNGTTFVAADSSYPIKTDAVRDLFTSSAELTFEEARTSDPSRYADLGLADPGSGEAAGKEVVFRGSAGDLADLIVGNRDSTVGGPVGGEFVRRKGEAQTYLARGNVRLPSTRAEWFADLDLGVRPAALKKIELSGGGRDAVTVTAPEGKPGELTLQDIPEKRVADSFKVSRLASLVESFTFQDVRKRSTPANDPRRMVVDLADGLRVIVTGVGDPTEGWVQLSTEATNDASKAKADALATKVEAYDFRLPIDRTELLGSTNAELTNVQQDPAPPVPTNPDPDPR
jgi:hypothetical protein